MRPIGSSFRPTHRRALAWRSRRCLTARRWLRSKPSWRGRVMEGYRVIYIDAFTRVPYAGNPCAVLPDARGLSDEQMLALARETNLSETSFVLPSERADFRVR